MDKKIYEKEFYGRKIIVELNELARQADGSALIRYEDTVILSTSVMNDKTSDLDFFPLTVLYNERLYSVGKIPGGFIKREGRPTENSTLISRLIDRPLRPLFAEGFRNEVQVVNTVLSVDKDNSPEMMAMLGSSLSLCISSIPFETPIAGVIVGRINEEFIINPTAKQLEESDIELVVAGTKEAINMVEASAEQVSEEVMIEALMFAHNAIKELISFEEEIIKEINPVKLQVNLFKLDENLLEEVKAYLDKDLITAIMTKDKLEREENIGFVKEKVMLYFSEKYEDDKDILKQIKNILEELEAMEVRNLIVSKKVRPDGRKVDEIRSLSASVDVLPRPHGSALFTRGQTQVMSITTLGAIGEHQILDGLEIEEEKRFMHHYNFPQFSVGSTGRYGAPGRREIGHGALGEKAMIRVLPTREEFPYTIRVVSEVLESNGSSSQASICAGIMSLMAAGVPIKGIVAGIAMGLITQDDKYTILTDIQGLEDHMGDMDFKVAGTKKGICALQMDIKIKGITKEILVEALEKAKKARLKVLKVMTAAISTPRKEVSKYAPKIATLKIEPEQIKDVIGRGGETITKLILDISNVKSVNDSAAVKIDIDDDGNVVIYHSDKTIIDKTVEEIKRLTKKVELNKKYKVKVVTVTDFGCFVELWPGCEGFVHVSQLDKARVEKTSDLVKVGDIIEVIATGYDNKNRLNLSRKTLLEQLGKKNDDNK